MDTNRRKLIGSTSALLTSGLAGCSGIADDVLGNEKQPEDTTGESTQSPSGEVTLEFDGEDGDEPFVYYKLENNTSDTLLLGTVMYFGSNRSGNSRRRYEKRYRIPAGDYSVFRFREDVSTVELVKEGTWTHSEYNNVSSDVNVVASPTGTTGGKNISAIGETPTIEGGEIEYSIPNPTEITGDDIKDIVTDSNKEFINDYSNSKAGRPDLEVNGGEFTFSSPAPIWASTFNVTVNGISNSQDFTFTASDKPDLDITIEELPIEDGLEDPTIEFTANSEMPVMNPIIAIVGKGPSIDTGTKWFEPKPSADLSGDDRVLITNQVGEARIGASETYTVETDIDIDYPLEDEDRLGIGVVSGYGNVKYRYPVTYHEGSINNLI